MIFLVTNKEDVTSDMVVNELNNSSDEYYRFNTEDICAGVDISFNFTTGKVSLFDTCANRRIDLSKVKSVYFRRPKLPSAPADLQHSDQQFVLNEISQALEGVYKYLGEKYWVSNVFAIRQAENKIHQQLIAHKFGFTTPKSIITNRIEDALEFLKANNQCVVKPIRTGFVSDKENPQVIFTSSITIDDVAILGRIQECPTYLQENIPKISDIRVTVIGSTVFSAKIHSQEFDETKTDWRKGENVNLKHEPINLGPKMNEACVNMTRFLDLQFGALDFILDDKGRYVFLEINPNGQWGWIQHRLNYNISGTIAKLLRTARPS